MLREGAFGSWNLSGRPWWLLVAPGVNISKLKFYIAKSILFIPQGYFERLRRSIFWIIQNAWRLSFCRLLDPRPENHQIKPHGAGFDDLAQYYIKKHFVIGSLIIGSSVRGSSAYYSPSQRGTHEKYVSTQKCLHNNLSVAAVTSHTLLWPAESALHEV